MKIPKTVLRIWCVMLAVYSCFILMGLIIYHTPIVGLARQLPRVSKLRTGSVFLTEKINISQLENIQPQKPATGPAMVVIIAYQRTGSTFLMQLFNRHPDGFAWFEPLDGAYTALYGTRLGYFSPGEIWFTRDGLEREIPTSELEMQVRVSKAILTCDFSALPVEVLASKFLRMFSTEQILLKNYTRCLSSVVNTMSRCNLALSRVCGFQFQPWNITSRFCAEHLQDKPNIIYHNHSSLPLVKQAVKEYQTCLTFVKKRVKRCLPKLTSKCMKSKLRCVKYVRLSAEAAERIKLSLPQAKFIHNFRDPRGALRSRNMLQDRSFYTFTKQFNLSWEAGLYCKRISRDLLKMKELELQHPGTVYISIYERLALYPLETARAIYNFVGVSFPAGVVKWLIGPTSGRTNKTSAIQRVLKWKNMSITDLQVIEKQCSKLFDDCAKMALTEHLWNRTESRAN